MGLKREWCEAYHAPRSMLRLTMRGATSPLPHMALAEITRGY